MSLTDTAIRAAKPAEKQQKLFDAKGLYATISALIVSCRTCAAGKGAAAPKIS